MAPSGLTALTLFGATELRRPTLAAEILHLRAEREQRRGLWSRLLGQNHNLALTFFGATVLVAPTLVEEYQAMTGLLRSGLLTPGESQALIDQLSSQQFERSQCRMLTVFGTCTRRTPSAGRERKALEAAEKAGTLGNDVRTALEDLIAAPPSARLRGLSALCAVS